MHADPSLQPFFEPSSVAVIGASHRETSVGYALLKNLLFGRMDGSNRAEGFQGEVFAVNTSGGELFGQRVYRSLPEIGRDVELIVVAIPPKFIEALIEEAGQCGVKAAIIISAGFAEMGEEGRALQDRIKTAAQRKGIRLIGPNCLGVLRPSMQLNASFAAQSTQPGGVGLLSQSGALVTGVISYANRESFGLSTVISLGGKADVGDEDVLLWLANDEATRAIAIYVEAFKEPRRFFEEARAVAKVKPVVAIKGGTSDAGAAAASSHTGSLAGSRAAYAAAFAQAGILEAHTIGDFVGWSRALGSQPPAMGKRLAILTNAGGPGVLAADAADRAGMQLVELSEDTIAKLDEVLPAVWSHHNPVDVIGDATPERYRDALNILGAAPEVDGIVLIMTVQSMTEPQETAEAIACAHEDPSWRKPLCCSFIGLIGTEVGRYLDARGVPEFNMPERAVSAMNALMRRGLWTQREEASAPTHLSLPEPDDARVARAIEQANAKGQHNLDLTLAREVLEGAGLRYNRSGTAANEQEAVEIAERIGYPVVVKVISPDVLHKSDVGGVALDLVNATAVRNACSEVREKVRSHEPDARIAGFTVEEQIKGTELIVGMSRDPGFGPLLMVGIGGIFVEVYQDVAFRLLPLSRRDALDAIGEIKAQALLDGARNRPVLDRAELAEVLLRISRLVEQHPEIIELDINPLVITASGLVAIDSRVILPAIASDG